MFALLVILLATITSEASQYDCGYDLYMNASIRAEITKMHNDKRDIVAAGKQEYFEGRDFPPGKNFQQLRYDCVLERKVQKDVNDACGWLGYFRRDFEGNRWVGHESKLKDGFKPEIPFRIWWDSRISFNLPRDNNLTYTEGKQLPFTKIIFAESNKIGCGLRRHCGDLMPFACIYSPEPKLGELIYEAKET